MPATHPTPRMWPLVLAAAGILMIIMGARQSLGLFVAPLEAATGAGIAAVSFALAVSQFVWGVAQPVCGVLADRYGTSRVVAGGAVLVALGTGLAPFARGPFELTLCLGVIAAAGAAAGSFSILIGGIARFLPEDRRAFASGFINAGSSFGQFLFAPLAQFLIATTGWLVALLLLAASALATIPLAGVLGRHTRAAESLAGPAPALRAQVRAAAADGSYRLLHLGFFTCGFHIAFLVTHLPGEVALCGLSPQVSANALALIGLANIGGSLAAGALCQRFRMKYVLAWMYASRAVLILAFLAAPRTATTVYVFAAALGFTWLATVPPTAGLVGKLFGTRHLATLFGLTLISHQVGGFFGAWLGGVTISRYGDYTWMWYADAVLAVFAALVHLPIREAAPSRPGVPA